MTEAELMDNARALAPALASRAQACEDLGNLPEETIADFEQAGFYRICQPKKYGGYELSPEVLFNVFMEVAKACPSSAWAGCLIGVHNWEPGLMNPRVAEDLWGEKQNTRYSSSFAPIGQLSDADGGYRLSGRWSWSSGSRHCTWVILGALRSSGGEPEQIALLLPASDYKIIDNWDVAGLKGTGSHDIVVDDVFVPSYRVHALAAPSEQAFGRGIYDFPFSVIFALCLAAVTQGIAEGAVESFTGYLAKRKHGYDRAAMNKDPFQLRTLADAAALVSSNRTRFHAVFRRMEAALQEQPIVPPAMQLQEMWDVQSLAQANADAVTRLFRAAGGNAQRSDHPLQRYFRDINAAVAHAYLNPDRNSLSYASGLLKASEMHAT